MHTIRPIQPPIEDFHQTKVRNIPLGLLSLAAVLKERYDVCLLDLRYTQATKAALPAEFQTLTAYYRTADASPFALYKSYQRFGYNSREIENLLPSKCRFFLISSLFTTYLNPVLELITLIRKQRPHSIIIIGGPAVSFSTEKYF